MTATGPLSTLKIAAPDGALGGADVESLRGWRRPGLASSAAILLLLLMAVRLEHAAWVKTVTFDETLHLGQGIALRELDDARLQPENGMLTQRLVGWAARLGADTSAPPLPETLGTNERWQFVRHVLYAAGDDPRRVVWASRQVSILCGLGLALLLWAWSRRLWGPAGGLITLALVSLSPDVLAHAALSNSDAPFWFAGMLALAAGWRLIREPRGLMVLGAGLALGVAVTSKFSGILLLPILGLLWLAVVVARYDRASPSGADWGSAGASLAALVLAGLVAWVTVWAVYRFRFAAAPQAAAVLDWSWKPMGPMPLVSWLRDTRLLPESFLWGLQHVSTLTGARLNFFAGEISIQGSVAYFPLALSWKTPVGTLILWALTLVAGLGAWLKKRGSVLDVAPLLTFSGVYFLAAVTSELNIGVRHVIPAVLPWFVLAGSLVRTLPPGRLWVAPFLALLVVLESLVVHPHHLAFFNVAAGGPTRGYRLLVDSNLDWGQDLDALVDYAKQLPPDQPFFFAYFGTASPSRHGLRGTALKTVGSHENSKRPVVLQPGVYAISATLLPNLYEFPALRGAWLETREPQYRQLRARTAAGDASAAEIGWYNRMVFSRLVQLLRTRRPDDSVNYSILVYRLDERDIQLVREGPLPP